MPTPTPYALAQRLPRLPLTPVPRDLGVGSLRRRRRSTPDLDRGKYYSDPSCRQARMISRACVRWFMDLEGGYLAEQEKLLGAMDAENTQNADLEAQLSSSIEELRAANLELTTHCESPEESLNEERSGKLLAIQSCDKESTQRELAKASRDKLIVDLERVTQEAKQFSEQLQMIQDTNKGFKSTTPAYSSTTATSRLMPRKVMRLSQKVMGCHFMACIGVTTG